MACFDNIISLEELCPDQESLSGFYLNQIGINKTEIEQYITKDFSSVQSFIDKKSAFAVKKVTSEVYSYLSPLFKADSILTGARIGYEATQKELISQSGYVGTNVTLRNANSYLDFVLSDISLFTDFTGTVPVLIYDTLQGKLLQTVNITTVAGQVSTSYEKVVVSAPRKQLNLWIGYDATAINSYKTITHSGCSECHGFTFNHKFIQATGSAIANPFTEVTLTNLTHTGGLSFNYSVACNHEDWLCNHRNILGLPILYKTGVEICNHALLAAPNQRTMSVTTLNRELMEQKLAYFEHEYNKVMSNILKNMAVPQDRNCFNCSQRIISIDTFA